MIEDMLMRDAEIVQRLVRWREGDHRSGDYTDVVVAVVCSAAGQQKSTRQPSELSLRGGGKSNLFRKLMVLFNRVLNQFVRRVSGTRKDSQIVDRSIPTNRGERTGPHAVIETREGTPGARIARGRHALVCLFWRISQSRKQTRLKVSIQLCNFVRRSVDVVVRAKQHSNIFIWIPQKLSAYTTELGAEQLLIEVGIVNVSVLPTRLNDDFASQCIIDKRPRNERAQLCQVEASIRQLRLGVVFHAWRQCLKEDGPAGGVPSQQSALRPPQDLNALQVK